MKNAGRIVGFILILAVVGFVVVKYYDYIFARTVIGKIEKIEKVSEPVALLGSQGIDPKGMFSFAIAIREKTGEIAIASSEDRKWAVVEVGKCAEAKFFPYPPWDLEKSGTYHKARLERLYDCPKD